ncbi:MAG: tripartite tricarboxylate transporter substrate binding protein [Pigmentiphaga sp.]|uniref:Bug family tripartite tricarboxylate transporter substrate binding protein n=1 Tax=Pigmentiphaga sp. TaxID=1977564 RepID=UPI0029B7168D|nr:tripartite tricarboxylate transporter substrate binding protein [Pigmentiphaga sp.]MDX3904543.1 tripartite tricarboxylate transporter substrate binding protein [Pigmentiphaga sp.]
MKYLRAALAAFCLIPSLSAAQTYPERPVRMVVPFAVGGAADTVARAVAHKLTETLGQTVIVDNRAGANSMIGSELVARADPDGYTLLMQLGPPHNTLPFFSRNVPYDPVKDFTPIAIIGTAPQAMVVNASLPVKNLKEFIAYAKARPGKLSYGTSGVGSSQQLGGELLKAATGIDMTHVPYKGGSPALNDVVGGQVPVGILVLSNVLPHVKSGKLRLLGVLQAERAKAAPEVPTLAQAGVEGFAVPDTWVGLLGPAGMPTAVVERLRSGIEQALASPDLQTRLATAGFEVEAHPSPAKFARLLAGSVDTYRDIVAKAGIEPE